LPADAALSLPVVAQVADETLAKHNTSKDALLLKKTEKLLFLEDFIGALALPADAVAATIGRVMASLGGSGGASAAASVALPRDELARTAELVQASARTAEFIRLQRQLADQRALIATLTSDAAAAAAASSSSSAAAAAPATAALLPPAAQTPDRSNLLASITQGTRLKKAVTVDKSGPRI